MDKETVERVDLKPCPFCGGMNIHLKSDTAGDGAEVICRDCQSAGPLVAWEDHETDEEVMKEASRLWNTRADTIPIVDIKQRGQP